MLLLESEDILDILLTTFTYCCAYSALMHSISEMYFTNASQTNVVALFVSQTKISEYFALRFFQFVTLLLESKDVLTLCWLLSTVLDTVFSPKR